MELLVVLLFILLALLVGCLIGALLIRASVAAYNKLSSGDSTKPVPEPPFGKSFGIVLATTILNGIAGFVLGVIIASVGYQMGMGESMIKVVAQLLSLPLSILVMAWLLAAMLPTTFVRGVLISLCYLAIGIVIAGGFFLLLVGVGVLQI